MTLKLQPHQIMQGVITTLLIALIIILESKAAMGAHKAQLDPVSGLQMAALSLACAAIAFIGFGLAGALKDDERDHVRRRAKAARFVALAFLASPIIFLGSSLKMDRQAADWEAYTASPAYAEDVAAYATASGKYERDRLREQITKPTTAKLSLWDAELWIALAVQILLIWASDAFRVPAPITAQEREHQKRSDAAKKAAATRKRNRNVVPMKPRKKTA